MIDARLTGLSAFPLTPLRGDTLDEVALAGIVRMLAGSAVDSITVLGSTGSYAYLDRDERQRVVATAVDAADGTPVLAGVGALRTAHAIAFARDAVDAGARALLLAPMSYQPLTDDDVHGLYVDVLEHVDVPLIVYDNPGTTRVTFTDALYARLAALPGVASIKIPGIPAGVTAVDRIARIRDTVGPDLAIGISGDAFAAEALAAGCDVWYSVIGGTLPGPALRITRAALAGDREAAVAASESLAPLWALFAEHGSYRVTAAIAEALGLAPDQCLPLPILGLDEADRARVREALTALRLE